MTEEYLSFNLAEIEKIAIELCLTAEIDLLLDDARAEGIAPDSPMELAIVMARYVELLDKGRRIPRASFALPGD